MSSAIALAICVIAGLFLIGIVGIFELRNTPKRKQR
jgi:hypothetical protein